MRSQSPVDKQVTVVNSTTPQKVAVGTEPVIAPTEAILLVMPTIGSPAPSATPLPPTETQAPTMTSHSTLTPAIIDINTPTPEYSPTLMPTPTPSIAPTAVKLQQYNWKTSFIDLEANAGYFSSLALYKGSSPRVAYYNYRSKDLMYAYIDDWGNWKIQASGRTGGDGQYCSLEIDSNELVHIIYYAETENKIMHAIRTGGFWDLQTRLDKVSVRNGIVFDLDGYDKPHILYVNNDSSQLVYASFTNEGMIISALGEALDEDVGIYYALAIDEANLPHITYYDPERGLIYTTIDVSESKITKNTVWDEQVVASGVGLRSAIDLGPGGNPHITYSDENQDKLVHSFWTGDQWATMPINDSSKINYTSTVVNWNSVIYISFYDETNKDLMFAQISGNVLRPYTIDQHGDVGKYNSLALDKVGIPRISYYDESTGSLKYAYASQ